MGKLVTETDVLCLLHRRHLQINIGGHFHIITSVKFIRNESFLSEFIGVFITERKTHSGRPFLPVQCKRGTALIFV